jgi:PAS domain S-box-containing protein
MEGTGDGNLRVVTVDDSPVVAERLEFMLAEIERVEFLGNAVNISAALHLISQQRPNVVILDIHLKDDALTANGVHLLSQLRKEYPSLKILMLTNVSVTQYKNTCLALGADYFFDKTNDFERIPETLKEIQISQSADQQSEVAPATVKILHVEDNPNDAELIERHLKKSHVPCDMKVVASAADYIVALNDFHPDVVLSDQCVPNFNSLDALEILRASGKEIPFILITGAVSEDFGVTAMEKGADDYILKDRLYRLPFAVDSALEKYRKERERKKTEEDRELARKKIEESEKQYVQLVHNLPAAVYTCDVNGKILLYNKAAVELWGRTPEVGEELWCGSVKLYDINENPVPREESPIWMAIKKRTKIEGRDFIVERPDGSRRYVTAYPTPNFNATGELIGATNTMIDVTEAKKATLESLMLVDRLQLKNRELSQFGYMISHNLRAPLARILGLASIFDIDPIDNHFIIEKIREATVDLDDVVRDINTVVSARDSKNEKKESVTFESQVGLAKQVLRSEILQSNASITTDFAEAKGVLTIKNYLYSMLYNLLSNAIKFRTPEIPLAIHLQSSNEQDYICLSVKDNGLGIDLERYGSKLFGLYQKFSTTQPGKGVGLHLIKVQAEALGGWVEVESKVNEGSEFRIFFPKNASPPAQS